MRINSSVNNIIFGTNFSNKSAVEKKESKAVDVGVQNLDKTPDYMVKMPQRYFKLETVNLPDNLKAHVYKLESGQKVVIVPKLGPTVIKTYVNTGALNENDSERGISHFVEHSLFNGSEGLAEGEFFETVNKMGANTNASTGFSATDYYIKSNLLNDGDFEKQVKIHASMLETPKFTLEMTEKEKGPVTSEISMILDDMENVAVNSTLKNLFNIKSTSQDIIGGTIENINNLTREKVLNYYKQNYYPSNMVTVITGDVKEIDAINAVSKYMKSNAAPVENRKFEQLIPIQKSVRSDIVSDKVQSSFISMGFSGPQNNNIKDKILFDAVAYILTESTLSRVNKELENLQSEASVTLERLSSKAEDNTALLLVAQVDDKNSEKAIKNINSVIKSLKTNPPTEDEINIIKKNLKFEFENKFEGSHSINSMIGVSMLDGGLSDITDYEKILDELKPQDFVEFANKYLDVEKQSLTVVHPAKSNKISFGARKPLETSGVLQKTLENNVLLIENSTDKNVAYVDLKLTNEVKDVKTGAAAILSGMLERGFAKQDKNEFYANAEKDGILLGFSADNNTISVSSAFMKQDAEKAFDSIKKVISEPRFTQEDFEEVKKQLIQDLKDIPENAKDGLYGEIFKGQVKGTTVKELLNGVQNITLDDVKALYSELINGAQMRAAVSGPFKNENFKTAVEQGLSVGLPKLKKVEITEKKSYSPIEKTKIITNTHNKSQAEIMMGYKFKIDDNSPENMLKFSLLNIILGGTASSRLFNDLRESQKLAYQVKSSLDYNDDDTGVCNLYIKTTTDSKETYNNIEKSIKGFDKHVAKLLSEKVNEEELENAKLVLKNRLYNDNETVSAKNASLLSNSYSKSGIELTNEVMNLIDNVSVEDLFKTAQIMFSNPYVCSIVAKEEALLNSEDFLNNRA